MNFKILSILFLLAAPLPLIAQKTSFAISENNRYFGYCTELSSKEAGKETAKQFLNESKLCEFRYYNIESQKAILKYRFYSNDVASVKISISPDGNCVSIKRYSNIIVINAQSKTIINDNIYSQTVTFPNYDNSFLLNNEKILTAYNALNGEITRIYDKADASETFGQVWYSPDDKYIIQRRSFNKYNIWETNNKRKLSIQTANSFSFDYVNNNITFVQGFKTRTYSLKDMKLVCQRDLSKTTKNYSTDAKTGAKKHIIKGNPLLSKSGNFVIIPYTEKKMSTLLLCSTQRDENKEIPIGNLNEVQNIEWLNDSIVILNHTDNTVSLLNLYDCDNVQHIDFGLPKNTFQTKREIEIAPNYQFYIKPKNGIVSNGFEVIDCKQNTLYKTSKYEYIGITSTSDQLIVKNIKSNKYGVMTYNGQNRNPVFYPFEDSLPLIDKNGLVGKGNIDESESDDAIIPENYNPHRITGFKHISELKDTSAIINLILKNIEFTDSTASINTHLIDDDGVYYYGAGTEEWKRIWCNFLLKQNGKQLKQITDFNVIEHRDIYSIPTSTAIVMDHSGSMGDMRAKRLQDEVGRYITRKNKDDALTLIKFDHKIGVEARSKMDTTKLLDNLKRDGLGDYGGSTALLDAANTATAILSRESEYMENRAILLTDGGENSSFIDKDKLIRRAINNNVKISVIGYGDGVDDKYLKSITDPTNGTYYQIYRSSDFAWIFNDIDLKSKNYYEIKFKTDTKTSFQSTVKICITNNQSDTLGVTFNTTPFCKQTAEERKNGSNTFDEIESEEEIKALSGIQNIENFDNVKIFQYKPELKAKGHSENDTLNQVIADEFDKIKLPDIKFEYNTAVIIESSLNGIDEVYTFLLKYNKVVLELAGHTDSDGDDYFNQVLSEQRAEKVKSILIERGISESRIFAIGFGESEPIEENDSEINKQINRRVEFRIMN